MPISKSNAILLTLLFSNLATEAQQSSSKIDYSGFLDIGKDLLAYRESRLINISTFNAYSLEGNTVILDTRSKAAYDDIHINGAVHLNFSDFTKKALKKIIPNKKTRILIYCNNNFESSREALTNKKVALALNIPTFINLYGYGYENIYELKDYLKENDERLSFSKSEKN